MRKNPSSVAKIAITIVLLLGFGSLSGFEGTASAPEIRRGPDTIGINGIQVLVGGSAASYSGWIADNDLNTAWQPDAGATMGVVELQFEKSSLLYGIRAAAALSENDEIAFEYLQDGQWVPLPTGRITGAFPGLEMVIPTAHLRIVTSAVRLELSTTLNGSSRLFEIGFTGIAADEVFHKIIPAEIRTSNGPDIVSPAEYLIDDNTYTTWSSNS